MTRRAGTRASSKSRPGRDAAATAARLHAEALKFHAEGQFEEARERCARSLGILERQSRQPGADVANILNTYGSIQQDLGLYAEAETIFRRSAGIAEGLSRDGAELERLRVRSFSHLADIIRVQGRYREAELMFERALSLAEAAFGPRDLHVSSVLNGWAVCYKYAGRFEDAERLYRRALEIMEKALGPEHVEIAAVYHNLGGLEYSRGRYAAGEPYARRSVEIREKALGAVHRSGSRSGRPGGHPRRTGET
jgi:tetratricopeptide (TPR) repeat protein